MLAAAPASAVTVISHSANTDVILGAPFDSLEFENPLSGTETAQGYTLVEWRDADFLMGMPPFFDDWNVNDPFRIDGNVNEIWLRQRGHAAFTSTTAPGTIVSIHLVGDENDGVAQVLVDGLEVARLDMNTQGGPQTACIIVKGLQNTPHNIEVHDLGPGPSGAGDDVAILGAGVLQKPVVIKWAQPPEDTEPPMAWLGWNERSVYGGATIAADDWRCETEDPVTDIHWWGSFQNWTRPEPPPDMPTHFHIAIWTDVPAGPENPWSHPGQVIWETDCYEFTMLPEGFDFDPRDESFETCFRFDQVLDEPEWFRQTSHEGIYWISIAAVYPEGMVVEHPWGWKTRPREPSSPAPDDAVRIFVPTAPRLGMRFEQGDPIFWPSPEQSWDLAFELTTGGGGGNKVIQPPDPSLPGIHAHDWSGFMMREWITLADDWICLGGPVMSFEWWGNYETDELGREKRGQGIRSFHLSIHQTIWGMPFQQPGPEIYGIDIPFSMVNETFTGLVNLEGSPIYHYEAVLPEPFLQEIEGWYWLDLTAQSNSLLAPAYWRWQEHSRLPFPNFASAVQSVSGGPWKQLKWDTGPVPTFTDLAFAVNSGISGAPRIKWSQPPVPVHPPGRFFRGWNEPSLRGGEQIVADDWVCTGERPVTDLHWWGSFVGWSRRDPPRLPDAFEIAIWTDVPAGPGQPWSRPGHAIHHFICEDYRWSFVGWDVDPRTPGAAPEACFLFEQDLRPEEWFWQKPGTNIYWVSISAIYHDPQRPEYPWGWKTRPRRESPDDAVRIFNPTVILPEIPFVAGEPIFWPTEQDSWDTAFILTSLLPGDLTFDRFKVIRDHFWWPRPGNPPNRMLSLKVSASLTEAVFWTSITLQAAGSGNDALDIQSVELYLDANANGVLDPGDVLLGSGAYPVDNGMLAIGVAPPVLIPAGGNVAALIVYNMNPAAGGPGGKTYSFTVTGATGTGQMTGAAAGIHGLPLNSARKIAVRRAVSIGYAKKNLPLGDEVFLEGKVLTADFMQRFGLFYVEEPDRSAGIGVVPPAGHITTPLSEGDIVHVLGTTAFYAQEQTELVIAASTVLVEHPGAAPIVALKMNNRDTGGGVFGNQPAVVDDALPGPGMPRVLSQRLNNVGSLVETWGTVTGHDPARRLFWIDDGCNLRDGIRLPAGPPSAGIAVLMPDGPGMPLPPIGSFLQVTGVIWAIPGGTPLDVYPVRLLVPRSYSDIVEVVGPGVPR